MSLEVPAIGSSSESSFAKRELRFVGATRSASLVPAPVLLTVDFLTELVMKDASLAFLTPLEGGGVTSPLN
jgi:hypothetical protein